MKNLSVTLALVIGILAVGKLPLLAQVIASGSTLMIVQTPNDTPDLHYYIYSSSDSGSAEVPFPISSAGDVFDLYVQGTAWDDKVYWLDSKVVNAYSPVGTFAVLSEDPWIVGDVLTGNYIRRTRADRTYEVNLSLSGLSADPSAPSSANSVRLDRTGVNYNTSGDPKTYSAITPAPVPYAQVTENIIKNGLHEWTVSNVLTPLDSTKVCGEERWELYRWADLYPDGTVAVPETIISNVTVQVWPVADVTLEGVVDGQEILDTIPSLSVQLKDVYPDSYIYCQVYKGTPVLDAVGTKVALSEVYCGQTGTTRYNTVNGTAIGFMPLNTEPINPTKFFVDLNTICATDGTYTLEVIAETWFGDGSTPKAPVWGGDRMKYITFKVNRRTAIRATLSSGN